MNFDSVFFISCFLPAVLLLYWLIPNLRGKNAVLLVFSLVFYAFSGIPQLFLLIMLSIINYLIGLALQAKQGAKVWVTVGICLNLIFLGVFKYLNFLLTQVFCLKEVNLGIAVPLGISFFSFKSIAYLIDICRNPENAARSFWNYLLYVTFFPQIITGPIARYRDFAPQLTERSHSVETAAKGLRRFIVGLAKKLVISGALGTMVDGIYALSADVLDARLAWIAAIGYSLQLFFDFSGYIDMANGLGNLFGFTAVENFDRPYTALTIGDFWRRWHISLSSWFKDYVYIPLGGNRKGSIRTGINKCIVFFLCGIWHGASWTFLLWGIWHGLFSLLESTGVIPVKKLKKYPAIGHLYTLAVVCIGFVMFRAGSVAQGCQMITTMFTGFTVSELGTVALCNIVSGESVAILLLGIVLCLPTKEWLCVSRGFMTAGIW